jgi:uncharacterized protein YqeY
MENQPLRARIKTARETAMLKGDPDTRAALDAVWAEIEKAEKAGKRPQGSPELDDLETITVINRVNKQYTEALTAFQKAAETADEATRPARITKVQQIQRTQAVLAQYLPQLMSREEIETAIDAILEAYGITDQKQMGKAIGEFNKQYPKRADNNLVKEVIGQKLAPK